MNGRAANTGAGHRARGAALLLVLWVIALLAALVSAFALTARLEHLQGGVLARGAVGAELARAGLELAVARVQDPLLERRWSPDGRDHPWRFADAELTVRIVDESGKVDLNAAQAPLLSALFRVFGAEPAHAERLAGAVLDWRDADDLAQPGGGAEDPQYAAAGLPYGAKDAPFETVGELQQLLGMTPALYDAVAPHVTVYTGQPSPDPRFAAAPVLEAMGIDPAPVLEQRRPLPGMPDPAAALGSGTGTYSIESRARLADGREAVLQAVVRVGGGTPGAAYTPLSWKEGVSASEP